jgi:radical SAM protein with 4Fe4S-binding SPASM domain
VEEDAAGAVGVAAVEQAKNLFFVLQLHITDKCNLRCKHCYQKNYKPNELALKQAKNIVEQFETLLNRLGKEAKITGHINLTGGEPLLSKNFFEIINEIKKINKNISIGILTNGTLIDEKTAKKIKMAGVSYIQVSLEGGKEQNDLIRGKGSFEKTLRAIKFLYANSVQTIVSFTASKKNWKELPKAINASENAGADYVWADRLVVCGSAKQNKLETLLPPETKEFFLLMKKQNDHLKRRLFGKKIVKMHRALQFLCGGEPYFCTAGLTLLAVMPSGEVYPCRRMPKKVGNVFEEKLEKIYFESPFLKNLRKNQIPSECEMCAHKQSCRGGLKCLSYALYGEPARKDFGCWALN